ncbi:MAG TPA: hypothetical protein VLF63_02195 [Patescibacteria group bacterium]|nr:hypothetical protein [Patescibacteria group bacterium]
MQYINSRSKFTKIITLILVILVVAIIGSILFLGSHAASPYVSLNAASGSLANGPTVQSDNNVSGGKYVKFGSTIIPPTTLNTVQQILYDMEAPNEGNPHGFNYPFPSLSYITPPPGFDKVGTWGQIYADANTAVEPTNIRVEVKNMESYVWNGSSWQRTLAAGNHAIAQYANQVFGGSHYPENFACSSGGTSCNITANKCWEADGGLSSTMIPGYNFHFYPAAAASLPAGTSLFFGTYQARIIQDNEVSGCNPSAPVTCPSNISQAHFVGDAGADRRSSTGATWNGSPAPSVGGGRFKYLSCNWKAINFYDGGPSSIKIVGLAPYTYNNYANAWTEAKMQSNPPTLDGM